MLLCLPVLSPIYCYSLGVALTIEMIHVCFIFLYGWFIAAHRVQTGPEALPNPPQSPLPSSTDPNFGVTRGPQPQIGRTHTSDPLQAAMESEVATTVIGNTGA